MTEHPFVIFRWLFLGMALAAALAGLASGQTDGSAADVTLRVSLSDYALIDNGDVGQHYPTVPVGEHVQDAILIDGHLDAFRYVYGHGDSPTPVCVFTARMQEDHHLHDVGGGRNCGGARGDDRCAYIAEGYALYAVAGGECSRFNIPACTGIC